MITANTDNIPRKINNVLLQKIRAIYPIVSIAYKSDVDKAGRFDAEYFMSEYLKNKKPKLKNLTEQFGFANIINSNRLGISNDLLGQLAENRRASTRSFKAIADMISLSIPNDSLRQLAEIQRVPTRSFKYVADMISLGIPNDTLRQFSESQRALASQSKRFANIINSNRLGILNDSLRQLAESQRALASQSKNFTNIIDSNRLGISNDFLRQLAENRRTLAIQSKNLANTINSNRLSISDDVLNPFSLPVEKDEYLEISNSLLKAKNFIFKAKDKDSGAIYLRIVLEDCIERMCKDNDISIDKQLARLNDELKKINCYARPQWRQILAWLDIGNAACHGKFDAYKLEEVEIFYKGLKIFITHYFN